MDDALNPEITVRHGKRKALQALTTDVIFVAVVFRRGAFRQVCGSACVLLALPQHPSVQEVRDLDLHCWDSERIGI